MDYISLEDAKAFLDITGSDQDDLLAEVIENATDMINIELGDSLELKEVTRRVDGLGTPRLIMENTVQDFTSARYKVGETRTSLTLDRIEGSIIYFLQCVPRGIGNVEVIYKKGYADVPADFAKFFKFYLKELRSNELSKSVANQDSKEIKSKSLESLSITYFSPGELANQNQAFSINYDKILNKYKNFIILRA